MSSIKRHRTRTPAPLNYVQYTPPLANMTNELSNSNSLFISALYTPVYKRCVYFSFINENPLYWLA